MDIEIDIPRVGTLLYIPELNRRNGYEKDNRDICWEVLSTATYQDNDGSIRTICTMLALDYKADQIETIETQKIDLDQFDHIDV